MKNIVFMMACILAGYAFGGFAKFSFASDGHVMSIERGDAKDHIMAYALAVFYDAVEGMDINDVMPVFASRGGMWHVVKKDSLDDVWRFVFVYDEEEGFDSPYVSVRDSLWKRGDDGKRDSVGTTFSFIEPGPASWIPKSELGIPESQVPRAAGDRRRRHKPRPRVTCVVETLPDGTHVLVKGMRRYLLSNPSIEVLPNGIAVVEWHGKREMVDPETGNVVTHAIKPFVVPEMRKRRVVDNLMDADIFVARFDATGMSDILDAVVVTTTDQMPIERKEVIEPLDDGSERKVWEFAFEILNRSQFGCQVRMYNPEDKEVFVLLNMVQESGCRFEQYVK